MHDGDDLAQDDEYDELRGSSLIWDVDKQKTIDFNKLETIQSGEHIFNFDDERYDILMNEKSLYVNCLNLEDKPVQSIGSSITTDGQQNQQVSLNLNSIEDQVPSAELKKIRDFTTIDPKVIEDDSSEEEDMGPQACQFLVGESNTLDFQESVFHMERQLLELQNTQRSENCR